MRFLTSSLTAYAVVTGIAVIGAVPAFSQSIDSANPYFDHAEGTMSTQAGVVVQQPAQTSGQYVATYHKYMQMDPRDTKSDANAAKSVDGGNIYFNHAEGTMSGN